MQSSSVRIKRVVIRSHPDELRGVVDLELLGGGRTELRLGVRHPQGVPYQEERLEIAFLDVVPDESNGPASVVLPRRDALATIVRQWLSGAFAKSIFGFGPGVGLFRSAECTFEMPVTFVLPSDEASPRKAVGWE